MKVNLRLFVATLLVVYGIYLGSYIEFRMRYARELTADDLSVMRIPIWKTDSWIFFRPLIEADEKLTGLIVIRQNEKDLTQEVGRSPQ